MTGGIGGPRRRPAALAAPLLALLVVAHAAEPRPAAAASDDGLALERTVGRVEIHGNATYPEGTLKNLLRTRGSSFWRPWKKNPLRPDYLRFDRVTLQDFYRRHGFLSARVDSVVIRIRDRSETADVLFFLAEGPRSTVESVRFEENGPIPEKDLRPVLVLRPGDPFDVPLQDLSREAVENQYLERGYVAARVRDSLEIEETRVRIVYRIQPGPRAVLGGVRVEGPSQTKPSFVTRELVLKPGDVLARSRLLLSQQRIYDSGFYADVQFDRGPIDSATSATDLIIGVRERKMGWIDAGIGYGTTDQLRLTSQIGQRNLFKDGYRFVATGRLGIRVESDPFLARVGDRRIDLALSRRWILGLRMNALLGVYAEEIPQIREEVDKEFRAYGGSFAVGRDFSRTVRGVLSIENRRVDADSVDLYPADGTGDVSYNTNRIAISLQRDTRVNLFDPSRGSDLVGTVEFAGGKLQGTSQFLKLSGNASTFRPVGRRLTLAFRLRAGSINPEGLVPAPDPADTTGSAAPSQLDLIPIDDRFRTGGATSVRGYVENEIGTRLGEKRGGRILLVGNAELRMRLFWVLGAVAFVDAGNVWERPKDVTLRRILSVSDGVGYNDMRYSAGAGLRIGTPIGPLRFDYGWKLRLARSDQPDPVTGRGAFHFSVGQAF